MTATATKRAATRDPFAPPTVGEPYTYTVTYSGIVEARNDDGSLVIGDHTVPRRTGNGVTMCMIGEPDDADGCATCGPDIAAAEAQADSAENDAAATRHDLNTLRDLIVAQHDEVHPGTFAFCDDPVCRTVGDQNSR